MYPAGALMVAQAIQDERLRDADRRRPAHPSPAQPRAERRDPWFAILSLPRFRVAGAKG